MGGGASSVAPPPRQLVLLGGGECGKTTLFKQIQILHGTGFEESTKQGWVDAIQGCVRRAVKQICAGIENSSTYSLSEENKARAAIPRSSAVLRAQDGAEAHHKFPCLAGARLQVLRAGYVRRCVR